MTIHSDEFDLPRSVGAKPPDLAAMGVEELRSYIVSLEAEIARAEAMIAKKEAHKRGVDALFGGTRG